MSAEAEGLEAQLNSETDILNQYYSLLVARLAPYGVTACVPVDDDGDLEFRKVGDRWGLFRAAGEDRYRTFQDILNTPRAFRIKASASTPELVRVVRSQANLHLTWVRAAQEELLKACAMADEK